MACATRLGKSRFGQLPAHTTGELLELFWCMTLRGVCDVPRSFQFGGILVAKKFIANCWRLSGIWFKGGKPSSTSPAGLKMLGSMPTPI